MRAKLTYANVMATVAVFIALGGTSYGAFVVTGRNVKNSSLTGRDVKNNSLTGADVKGLRSADITNGSLLARDFKAGQLPAGAKGEKGDKGDTGTGGARLLAKITAPGAKIEYGSGVTGATRIAPGQVNVTFNRSLEGCVPVASTGFGNPSPDSDTETGGSSASASLDTFHPNLVEVATGSGGSLVDNGFFLAIFC